MSRADDNWFKVRFEKLRILAICIAMGLFILSLVTEYSWLHWLRGLFWVAAGIAGYFEARAAKRLGLDPGAFYLRAVACVLVGVICVL